MRPLKHADLKKIWKKAVHRHSIINSIKRSAKHLQNTSQLWFLCLRLTRPCPAAHIQTVGGTRKKNIASVIFFLKIPFIPSNIRIAATNSWRYDREKHKCERLNSFNRPTETPKIQPRRQWNAISRVYLMIKSQTTVSSYESPACWERASTSTCGLGEIKIMGDKINIT